jgi:hypothetical protein
MESVPTTPGTLALLDTSVIYCGDNLKQLQKLPGDVGEYYY